MHIFSPLPDSRVAQICDPRNKQCSFKKNGYVGNEKAVQRAVGLAKNCFASRMDVGLAMNRWHEPVWTCPREHPLRILLTGPRAVAFARAYLELIGTDYETLTLRMAWADLDGKQLKNRDRLLDAIRDAFFEVGTAMIPDREFAGVLYHKLPPMVLFIDQVDAIPIKVRTALRRMADTSDGILHVGRARCDCRRITIIVATGDPGRLDPTFSWAFPIRITLPKRSERKVGQVRDGRDWFPQPKFTRIKSVPREPTDLAELESLSEDCAAVTNRIVESLRQGVLPWRRPWHATDKGALPGPKRWYCWLLPWRSRSSSTVESCNIVDFAPAEHLIKNSGAVIHLDSDAAYYEVDQDVIHCPHRSSFKTTTSYYQTVLHELSHWTGHSSRLNRTFGENKQTREYAFEELVAELASCFLVDRLEIPDAAAEMPRNASYLSTWLACPESDERFIHRASVAAQRATEYLLQFADDGGYRE
jgi:hypothetical protein